MSLNSKYRRRYGAKIEQGLVQGAEFYIFVKELIGLSNGIFIEQLMDSSRTHPQENVLMTHPIEVVDDSSNLALM